MRVSVTWLRELVDVPEQLTVQNIADRLTMAGLEVEAVEDLSKELAGVTVGHILAVEPHPHADKLHVCQVDSGAGVVQVVCGAPNVQIGTNVAFAKPGSRIGGRTIESMELRGVASHGMLCSEKELGLGDNNDGLLLIDDYLSVGGSLAQALGADTVVFEIGVTPNRPDALSHVGVARELAALTNGRLKIPLVSPAERGGPIDDVVQVAIEDIQGCQRYACRVIENVTIGPSPAWLKQRLQRCGVRSINNVVDVTNYVLLERGHPLHAFDLDQLSRERGRASVVVRRARAGERLETLDRIERKLDVEDLIICDADRPIALAGVMGGADTEVGARTNSILLEAAYFKPQVIRRASRRHGLHTEASHRFERGCDPNRGLDDSLNRAAQLIAELGGGVVRRGLVDVYPKKIEPRVVSYRPSRAASLLGVPQKIVGEANVGSMLGALGLEVAGREGDALHFRVPTWRPDLEREVDLIEEVLRLVGMDRVEETLPRGSGRLSRLQAVDVHENVEKTARDALLGLGYHEAVSYSFYSPREDNQFAAQQTGTPIVVQNALGEEQSVMRRSLLPRLLSALAHNQRHGVDDVRLFEMGKVFLQAQACGRVPRPKDDDGPIGGDSYAIERLRLSAVAVGATSPVGIDVAVREIDFFEIKGAIEELIAALGCETVLLQQRGLRFLPASDVPFFHPRSATRVVLDDVELGVLGELHPDIITAMDLRGTPVAFELDFQALVSMAQPVGLHQALPRFPKIRRDVALIVDDNVSINAVTDVIKDHDVTRSGLLIGMDVFDVYRGPHVPPGKKSVALAFEFRAADRTLVDDEVNVMHENIVVSLVNSLGAEVRK